MKRVLCCLVALFALALGATIPARAEASHYGAWLPYWEYDASLGELAALPGRFDEAVAFAAIFDSDDQPLMLSESETLLTDLRKACKGTDTTVFLSVVNDIQTAPGTFENKSVELLARLFKNEDAAGKHLEALVKLVDTYRLDGLEPGLMMASAGTALAAAGGYHA